MYVIQIGRPRYAPDDSSHAPDDPWPGDPDDPSLPVLYLLVVYLLAPLCTYYPDIGTSMHLLP